MGQFENASFDVVISSSTLEHDLHFWKTLSEVRRILKVGGIFAVMDPGYNKGIGKHARILRNILASVSKVDRMLLRGALQPRLNEILENSLLSRTSSYHYHWGPKDCYRFSEDSFRDVFMEGFDCQHFDSILDPPRLVAVGIRKQSAGQS